MSEIVSKIGNIVGQSIKTYHNSMLKPRVDDIKFKEQYQGRIIDCMIGEIDDNYITTPETDAPIVKLEYSKEGLVIADSIKGKTIIVDQEGNEVYTPDEGCRYVSVGEEEDNRLFIRSNNKNLLSSKLEKGHWSTANGNGLANEVHLRSINFIPIHQEDVTLLRIDDGAGLQILHYDKYYEYIGFKSYGGGKYVQGGLSHYPDTKYVKVNILNTQDLNVKSMLLEGLFFSPPFSYIEAQSHTTEILLDEPLRSLPNGVCDEIVGNKIIRRVGIRPKVAVADKGVTDINRAD